MYHVRYYVVMGRNSYVVTRNSSGIFFRMVECGRSRPFEVSLVLSADAFARTSAIAATTAAFRMVEMRAATRFRDPTLTRLTRPSFRPFLSSYKNSYPHIERSECSGVSV